MSFQTISLYVMLAILIVLLIIIGYNMSNALKRTTWPPLRGDCPDFWFDQGTGGSRCTVNDNGVNRGTFTGTEQNFARPPYTGSNGICEKKKWSETNGQISWDGITYGVENVCRSKPTTGRSR